MEILVLDGRSTDDTLSIVQEFAARCPQLQVLDNPGRVVPIALNSACGGCEGK